MTIQVAIYCRISDDRTGLALNVAEQEINCRKLCADRGWDIHAVYSDNDISASRYSSKQRPGYTAMMSALEAGEFSAVVTVNSDRLYRRIADLASFTAAVQKAHAKVATVSGGDIDLSTADGVAFAGHLGVAAQHQSDRASERQRDKQAQLARDGQAHGKSFGINEDGRTLNAREATIIRDVAQAIIDGESIRSQCQRLNKLGIRTARNNKWLPTSLRRLLKSPRVIGQREHLGAITTAQWPPIITPVQQAQLLAKFSAYRAPSGRPAVHLLSGILRCGLCGVRMVHSRGCYVCCASPRGCQKISIIALKTEEFVIEAILAKADMTPIEFITPSDGGLAEMIAADRETVLELAAGIANRTLSVTMAQTAAATIESRIDENVRSLAAQTSTPAGIDPEAGREFHLRDYWDDCDLDERRWIIGSRVDRIDVMPSSQRRTRVFSSERIVINFR